MLDWLELFGVATCLLYIVLEIKQRTIMWVVGFISSAVYMIEFFRRSFYAMSALNVYYMAASIYGIYCWRFATSDYAGNDDTGKAQRAVTRLKLPLAVVLAFISVILFAVIAYILKNTPDSAAPFCEAFVVALSIVATWMLARKIIEQWILWIIVNFFSSALYLWSEMYPTSGLYVIYGIMSVVGWFEWKRSINKQYCQTR